MLTKKMLHNMLPLYLIITKKKLNMFNKFIKFVKKLLKLKKCLMRLKKLAFRIYCLRLCFT